MTHDSRGEYPTRNAIPYHGAAPRDEARELEHKASTYLYPWLVFGEDGKPKPEARAAALAYGEACRRSGSLAAAPRADTDRMEQLEEALRPFAKWADMSRWVGCHDATPLDSGFGPTVADLRYAHDLLAARAPGRAE